MAPQPVPATTQATQASHTTAVNVLQSFPFLDLPAELRNKIYCSILVHDRALFPTRRLINPVGAWTSVGRYEKEKGINTQILRVNKQISQKAYGIFLNENQFNYMEDYETTVRWPRVYREILRKDQERSISRINTLKKALKTRAEFGYSGNDMMADFFQLLGDNKNLASLHIEFSGLKPHYLKTCQQALPLLERVKVSEQGTFVFNRRVSRKVPNKTEIAVCGYLQVLKKMMLEK